MHHILVNKMNSSETDFNSDEESIHSFRTSSNFRVYKKSREELNEIEKLRTRRINEQILSIRGLLDISNVPTRKDKYSVLCSAHDFIVSLMKTVDECRLILDSKRLTSKISEYSKFYPERFGYPMMAGEYDYNDSSLRSGYDHLLKYSRSPMALMTIDAKFISCNESFCSFTGFSSDELLVMSLFNLSTADHLKLLFKSVGALIDQSGSNARHIWNQFQFKYKECLCFTSLWIVGDNGGGPAFIQMMLVSVEDSVSGVGQNHSQPISPTVRTTSSSPLISSATTTYIGGDSRMGCNFLPRAVDPVQNDLWTDKQKCVAMLRQKFAETQNTNPTSSILPLVKIKQEYGNIQQQYQGQQWFQGDAVAALPPPPLPPHSLSSSGFSWCHLTQRGETLTASQLPPQPQPQLQNHQTQIREPRYNSQNSNADYAKNNNQSMKRSCYPYHPLFTVSASPQDYDNHNSTEQSLAEDKVCKGNYGTYTNKIDVNLPL